DAANAVNAAARPILVEACRRDFDRLTERLASKPADLKRSVSPSERGFLGKLWGGEPPDFYTELKPQLDAILKGKDVAPAQQAEKLKKQLAERDEKIAELNQQQAELQHKLRKLETDRSSTEQQIAEQRDQLQAEIEKLKTLIATAQKERDTARNDAARLEASFDGAQAQMSTLTEKQNVLTRRLEEAQKAQKDTTAELTTTQDQLKKAETELEKVSGKLDLETKQGPAWYWEKFGTPKTLFSLISLGFLIGIVFSILFWVGEVRGRQKLELFLTTRIDGLREDLANGAQDSEDECQNRRKMLCEFERHLGTLQTLTVSGTDHDGTTLGEIRNHVFTLIEKGPPLKPTDSLVAKAETPDDGASGNGVLKWFEFILPRYMASDLLLSLVVIMSGAVGAVVAALRATRALSLADLGFGVAAGFITLLAIRGGKNVFMVGNEDVSFYLNPYSSAFVGLLAGLFTDKAYGLLRKFVEKLVVGIESSFDLNNLNGAGAPASASEKTARVGTPATAQPPVTPSPPAVGTEPGETATNGSD
ncbi:MAG: hypothetical protein HQ518_06645, partial [Rhodopirellula sp.]|nr:hypothetical protein [Rhodopirellula sp.]